MRDHPLLSSSSKVIWRIESDPYPIPYLYPQKALEGYMVEPGHHWW